jgi:hypothetical protein
VLGHFRDDRQDVSAELRHFDWLASGSTFTRAEFVALIDSIASGMLDRGAMGERARRSTGPVIWVGSS